MNKNTELAKQNMLVNENLFSQYACKACQGIRFYEENGDDIRPIFFRDIDRIIHSFAYTRYIDKTQVYSFVKNDHITHRVLHVQLVSKIARTIGRSLKLNEDLIEAIALGHDVGHTPFGHNGERFLNRICEEEGIGQFCHNAQSVRVLKDLEKVNISLQTLDGILAHNGEILLNKYQFNPNKTREQFLEELDSVFKIKDFSKKIVPMTLEASVVRISDIIAYIGRDIEDAIKVGSIKREDVPSEITAVLGNNNSAIVNTLTLDIINNSMNREYLSFSEDIFTALVELKKWNYKNIYSSKEAIANMEMLENKFREMFYKYIERIKNKEYLNSNNYSDIVLRNFVEEKSNEEMSESELKKLVIDYMAGQTDKFFLQECNW